MEIDNQVRIQIPDGWEVQPGDIPGLGIYVFAIVPEGTAPDALVPGGEPADFPYLTLLNIGRTNGAEGYAPAQLEADKENSDLYSDIKDLDSITIGDSSFYGYEGNLTTSHHDGPFQYWYGDANSDTYKFEIFGERQGDIPRELIDAMKSAEFIR